MINYDLKKIKAIIFDIDGVLSAETITLSSDGVPLRTVNIKDGYAIQLAMKLGLRIVVMTGANVSSICRVGCPVCPKDACPEIKEASVYVSDCIGGHGCGRDVIEQTLRAQGKWVMDEKAFGW